ncbi:hypothetical protein GO755_36970 [Spirosoma sp. HMF4905]|uniref:Uncharacterized protein n=1 Tax=Spirosoma arboris TaxID=2682092 RepID=A0A7K1SPG2_9BACT|nr:hypothetical protein [Spirosoma arboris]MVM35667.1 hypothetical protein [Spirosoma arboris]
MALSTSLFALLGCSSTAQNQVVRGPLSIGYTLDREYSLNLFKPNANGKLIGTHTTSYFTINFQGKPVVVKNKEGKKVPLWQARFLADAPKPALLATSNGIYLITDNHGQPQITTVLDEGIDLSTYQWLDSEQGQPGRETSSYPMDNSTSSRLLSGGRYLLVGNSASAQIGSDGLTGCSVLDVHTLSVHPIDWSSQAAIQRADGFVRVSSRLVSCSPGKTQLVFLGRRDNHQSNRPEYALLAVNFVKNQIYAVPFRASAMQFMWAEDATSDWAATYFDWTRNRQGAEVLSVHPYTQHPPWHGRWAQDPGEGQPIRYELKPVLPGMFDHFMSWAQKQYPAIEPNVERSEGMIHATFTINRSVFDLYVRADYRSLGLESKDQTLLRTIGDQFDEKLRQGLFQDGFGEMDPD